MFPVTMAGTHVLDQPKQGKETPSLSCMVLAGGINRVQKEQNSQDMQQTQAHMYAPTYLTT
jgi:hypothetical protein